MPGPFVATAKTTIKAPARSVWKALTDPAMISQYLFGTEAASDWKVGSPITYRGTWQGRPYEDKGTILALEPGRLLASTYWSSMSGLADEPGNYNTVTWELSEGDGATTLTVTQDNNPSQESADHSQGNWETVLKTLKDLLER